jgi:hypothetical protein
MCLEKKLITFSQDTWADRNMYGRAIFFMPCCDAFHFNDTFKHAYAFFVRLTFGARSKH